MVDDLGYTVMLAEHRLERVVQYATRVGLVGADRRVTTGAPAAVLAHAPVAPPVVELGRALGWSPLPLSVRDARPFARATRAQLAARAAARRGAPATPGDPVVTVTKLHARYGSVDVLRNLELMIGQGEIVAVMGRNGVGKSTLLTLLAGLRAPAGGRIDVLGAAPHTLDAGELVRRVALVPADAGVLLYERTVDDECALADKEHGLALGATRAMLDHIEPGVPAGQHPRDLSEGQRLALALAVVLAPAPPVLLLDEPTRGLDYAAKVRLAHALRELAGRGHAVVLATHDVELVAEVATRAVVLADRDIVADGPAREVVCHSPVFAPQVAKVFAPDAWLTVTEVREALTA
jgi:energy-coupling factor transport system ATP-binding protein